jgi:hypothetical protein
MLANIFHFYNNFVALIATGIFMAYGTNNAGGPCRNDGVASDMGIGL